MSVLNFVSFLLALVFVQAIYVPNEDNPRKLSNIGVKTLSWQNSYRQPENVTVHHNYSKVYLNQPNQSGRNYSYSTTYSQQVIRTPKINDNIEDFSQDTVNAGHTGNFGQHVQTVDQHVQNFDQQSENHDQQSYHIGYGLANSHNINNQLGNFTDTNQGLIQNSNQHSQGFNQQSHHFSYQSQTVERESQIGHQQNVSLPSSSHQINNQLGGFGATNQHFNGQTDVYAQHVVNKDDAREFTNAHSGGYPRVKSERLVQNIQFNPKGKTQFVKEKIEVHKKCPKGATGQFVYELSCNQFLNCWKGRGYVQNCAPGTLFNPETLECDYKDKVICVTGPRETAFEKREPLSAALQARCPQGFTGIIPHYTDCSKFINCNNGAEVTMDCAPGTLFDIRNNMCDFPYKALCVGGNENQISSNIEQNQGYSSKLVTIQPYKQNVTYQFYTQHINDHLQGFGDGTSSGQNVRGSRIYEINTHQGVNNQLEEFESVGGSNRDAFDVHLNPNRYKPGQSSTFTNQRNISGQQGHGQHQSAANQGFGNNQWTNQNIYGTNQSQGGFYNGRWDEQNRHNQHTTQIHQHNKSPTCPPGGSGLYPHPTICEKFLNCDNGRTFIQDCGPGTVFNPTLKVCDYPYNVKCENQYPIDIRRTETDTSTDGTYFISNNKQIQTQEQQGQENRNYRMIAALSQAYTMGLSEDYCQSRIGFLIYPQNCSIFLYCDSGKLFIGICSENMYFNPLKQTCERNVNCNSFINQQSDVQNWYTNIQYQNFRLQEIGNEIHILNLNDRYCEVNDGFSPHLRNCSRFLLCTKGKLLLGICNANTFYDPSKKLCETNYNCAHIYNDRQWTNQNQNQGGGQNLHREHWSADQLYENFRLIEAGNEMNSLKLGMHYCQYNDGFSIHPKNCSKFLLCQNGKLLLGICKSRTFFNPATKTCEDGYRCKYVETGHSQTRERQNVNWENDRFVIIGARDEMSILNLDINYCRINDGFSEHPNNCSRFLYCKNDRLYVGICKSNMKYNQTSKTCDYTSGCKPVNYQTTNAINCQLKPNGFYPHPKHCNKYISCTNGAEMTYTCAVGTVFNSLTQICDFPYKVNCNDRQASHGSGRGSQQSQNQGQGGQWHQQQNQNQWNQQQNQNQWQEAQWNQQQNRDQLEDNQWNQQQGQNQWQEHWNQQQNRGEGEESQLNQHGHWHQQQNQDEDNEQQWLDQNKQWLTTQSSVPKDNNQNILTYDQNKKPSNKWPPPFPSTDPNADYVFEYNDLIEVDVTERPLKKICEAKDFRCTKTSCIEPRRVCDGYVDCPDGEDEKNCEKYVEEFNHTRGTKMAVKEREKYDNITVTLCAKYCIETRSYTCKAFNFRHMDGACYLLATNVGLSGSLFKLPTYDYFEYSKYSIDCSDKYLCSNQKCIDKKKVCDGVKDCVDGFDEKGCKAEKLGYSIRLVGSEKSYQGAIQVSALGKTGYVCDDMFNIKAANVLCKELGFEMGALEVKGNSYFMPNLSKSDTFYMMDNIVCDGNERSIKDCDFNGWGINNCMEKEVVGVVCKTPEEICAADYWKCETVNECIPLAFLCDEVEDCSDKSDEGSQYCDAPLEMRLVDGDSRNEGRVEVKYHGTWGTICDDDFNDDAAKVICRSLGYSGPAHVKKDAYFGQGSGPIWLDQVFCHGNETTIVDCIRWDWGVHNCEHSEDVGVICNDYKHAGSVKSLQPQVQTEVELLPSRCGYRNDDVFLENDEVHFRVVRGSVAKRGHYPWQASLKVKGKTKPSHWCGAVVISSKFVLTAAHCLHGYTKGAYVIVAGDYDVNEEEGTEQQAYIDEFYLHEDYKRGTRMNNDIAVVRLKENGFKVTKDVQPICLPDADFTDEAGLNCTISGFGSVRSGKSVASKELRAGWIPIQPSEVCKMPHVYGKAITDGMFCAGPLEGGADTCDGDSGGPLACLHNGLFTLIGMTSWGQHCGEANKPGVYVKVAHYRHWIDSIMSKHG